MHKSIMGKLSFSNVISVIALFVALSGAAYAGVVVTGKSIENRSITGKDIAADAITGKQIKEKKLHGVLSCGQATPLDVGDLCVGPVQPATSWQAALDACGLVNLRLPSIGEAMLVTNTAQHRNNNYIWTSDYVDVGPPSTRAVIRTAPVPRITTKTATDAVAFRCVSSQGNR